MMLGVDVAAVAVAEVAQSSPRLFLPPQYQWQLLPWLPHHQLKHHPQWQISSVWLLLLIVQQPGSVVAVVEVEVEVVVPRLAVVVAVVVELALQSEAHQLLPQSLPPQQSQPSLP